MNSHARALSLVFLGAITAGCTADEDRRPPKLPPQAEAPRPPAAQAPSLTSPDQGPPRQDVASPTSGSIHIDDKIVKACGDIPTAHFAFDSSAIGPDASLALDALGRCFVSGPLKGRTLRLVGHADPRGETEYNLGLGQRRAGSVAAFLAGRGLEKARIQTVSKGSLEATGTDEEGFARDRRVDVFLVESP